jgi:hypothetical protein
MFESNPQVLAVQAQAQGLYLSRFPGDNYTVGGYRLFRGVEPQDYFSGYHIVDLPDDPGRVSSWIDGYHVGAMHERRDSSTEPEPAAPSKPEAPSRVKVTTSEWTTALPLWAGAFTAAVILSRMRRRK